MNVAQLGVDFQQDTPAHICDSPGGRRPKLFKRTINSYNYYAYESPAEKIATPYFTTESKAAEVWEYLVGAIKGDTA